MPINNNIKSSIEKLSKKILQDNINSNQMKQTLADLENIMSEVEQEVNTTQSSGASSKDANEEGQEAQISSLRLLDNLKRDHTYLEDQIKTLEDIKAQKPALYDKIVALSQLRDTEVVEKIHEFKQITSESSLDANFQKYLTLFALRTYLKASNPDFFNQFLPSISELISSLNKDSINFRDEFGKSVLFYVVQNGDMNLVQDLINRGADVNVQSLLGYTPLHMGVLNHKIEAIKVLLQNGADGTIANTAGAIAITKALDTHQFSYFCELLNLGLSAEGKDLQGLTILHKFFTISNTITVDEDGVLESLEAYNEENVLMMAEGLRKAGNLLKFDVPDNSGNYPMHYAAGGGTVKILEYFVNKGLKLDCLNNDNASCLSFALLHNKLENIAFLLQESPKLAGYYIDNVNQALILHYAANTGNLELLKLVWPYSKAFIDQKIANGDTALLLSARAGHYQIAEFLLQNGADYSICDLNFNDSPLAAAIKSNHNEVAELLMGKKELVNLPNAQGVTPLHLAFTKDNVILAQKLVEQGADISDPAIQKGNKAYPLELASQFKAIESVKFLLAKGVKLIQEDSKNNPLSIAVSAQFLEGVKLLACKSELLSFYDKQGFLPLHYAAIKGDLEILNKLISVTSDVNVLSTHGANALYLAVQKGFKQGVEVLLSKGCFGGMLQINGNNSTPLIIATSHHHTEIVKLIAEHFSHTLNLFNYEGLTALHLAAYNGFYDIVEVLINNPNLTNIDILSEGNNKITALYLAAQNGFNDLVTLITSKGANPFFTNEKNGYSILISALRNKKSDTAKLLIKDYPDLVKIADKQGILPLHLAVYNGFMDVAEAIVSVKADHDAANTQECMTAFYYACQAKNKDMALFLYNNIKPDLSKISTNGYNGLMWALQIHDVEFLRKEILPKISNINHCDNDGRSALTIAAMYENYEDIVALLIKAGANVNWNGYKGYTPLATASSLGHFKTVELLIKHGANVNYKNAENFGNTALHYAAEKGNLDIIKLLVEHKADIYASLSDNSAQLPFHKAAIFNQLNVIQYFIEELNFGIDLKTETGFTPLILASEFGNIDIIKYLLNRGANLSLQDDYKQDAFLSAICGNKIEIVKLLVEEYGADVHTRNTLGSTALHIAAQKGNIEMAKLLISYGVKTDILDNKGQQFFELAPSDLKEGLVALNVEAVKNTIEAIPDIQHIHGESCIMQEVAEDIENPTLLEVIGGID